MTQSVRWLGEHRVGSQLVARIGRVGSGYIAEFSEHCRAPG